MISRKIKLSILPAIFILVGLIVVGIGIYNSKYKIIPVYETSFVNTFNVSLTEDSYQRIQSDTMQIVVSRRFKVRHYSVKITTPEGVHYFNMRPRSGAGSTLYSKVDGWITLPKTKEFSIEVFPSSQDPFSLVVNYIK